MRRGRAGKKIDPRVDRHAFRLLRLHHAQRLVKDSLARLTVVEDLNLTLCKWESTTVWVFMNCDAPPECEFDEDTATQRVGDVVIPE